MRQLNFYHPGLQAITEPRDIMQFVEHVMNSDYRDAYRIFVNQAEVVNDKISNSMIYVNIGFTIYRRKGGASEQLMYVCHRAKNFCCMNTVIKRQLATTI